MCLLSTLLLLGGQAHTLAEIHERPPFGSEGGL